MDGAVLEASRQKFMKAVGNDLNTSLGVTAVYDALKANANDATRLAVIGDYDRVLSLSLLEKAAALREKTVELGEVKATMSLGAGVSITVTGEGDPAIDALVLKRAEAKKAKNFAEADRIRDELRAQGIELTDTPAGVVWKRI